MQKAKEKKVLSMLDSSDLLFKNLHALKKRLDTWQEGGLCASSFCLHPMGKFGQIVNYFFFLATYFPQNSSYTRHIGNQDCRSQSRKFPTKAIIKCTI